MIDFYSVESIGGNKRITFTSLTVDEDETPFTIFCQDAHGSKSIAEYDPKIKTLYIPFAEVTEDMLRHEGLHILHDYFREMYRLTGIYPYDDIRSNIDAFSEEFIAGCYTMLCDALREECKE
jgi:hypothetical protein